MAGARLLRLAAPALDKGQPPRYIFDGDSLTAGVGASDAAHRWPNVFMQSHPGALWVNAAADGQTIANLLSDAAAQIDPAYPGNPNARVMCWAGANDLGANPTTTYNNIVTYHTGRR